MTRKISVVIPVYRSESILPKTLARLDAFFAGQDELAGEIIFVVDGSPDASFEVLRELKGDREDVLVIDLLRNYGQHSAMICGIEHATGDFVLTMDDDLQNPPEEIIKLVRRIEEGHDVVFGRFMQKMHGGTRKLGTKFVGWLNQKLFAKPADLTLTNFRIMRAEIARAICAHRSSHPYLPGLLLMTGKTFANVDVEHHAREEGQSNYTLKVILKLIWRIIFNYSAFPLRMLTGIGLVTAVGAFLLGSFYLVRGLITGSSVQGWTTLVVLMAFFQGLTLLILAAMGEYVVKIVNDIARDSAYRIRTKL